MAEHTAERDALLRARAAALRDFAELVCDRNARYAMSPSARHFAETYGNLARAEAAVIESVIPPGADVVTAPSSAGPERETVEAGVTQTILASDETLAEGVYGNCMQASVATLLGKPLDAVPHFGAFTWWPGAMTLWLRGEGLDMTQIDAPPIPQERALLVGKSPRNNAHMVVSEGGEIVWDPHPSRGGLTEVTGAILVHPWETDVDASCWVCGGRVAAAVDDARRGGAETALPRVKRKVRETGIRFPDGQVATGANIPNHRVVPGEVEVSRTRTSYEDDVTEWRTRASALRAATEEPSLPEQPVQE